MSLSFRCGSSNSGGSVNVTVIVGGIMILRVGLEKSPCVRRRVR